MSMCIVSLRRPTGLPSERFDVNPRERCRRDPSVVLLFALLCRDAVRFLFWLLTHVRCCSDGVTLMSVRARNVSLAPTAVCCHRLIPSPRRARTPRATTPRRQRADKCAPAPPVPSLAPAGQPRAPRGRSTARGFSCATPQFAAPPRPTSTHATVRARATHRKRPPWRTSHELRRKRPRARPPWRNAASRRRSR